jgi:hypothetical protein
MNVFSSQKAGREMAQNRNAMVRKGVCLKSLAENYLSGDNASTAILKQAASSILVRTTIK